MADFQYKSGTWQDVPAYAHPDDEGSITVVYPEPTERDGLGAPCGAIGLPHIEILATQMRGDGWAWWQAFFADANALTAAISLTAYNPRTATWIKYAGTLLRPLGNARPGGSATNTIYTDVTIIVEQITVTT